MLMIFMWLARIRAVLRRAEKTSLGRPPKAQTNPVTKAMKDLSNIHMSV
jgi:hypothetical protein